MKPVSKPFAPMTSALFAISSILPGFTSRMLCGMKSGLAKVSLIFLPAFTVSSFTSYIMRSGTVAMRMVVSSGVSLRMPDFFAFSFGLLRR
jgi:hypothetical protein